MTSRTLPARQHYVGELLEHTGSAWLAGADGGGGKVGATAAVQGVPIGGTLDVNRGVCWRRSIELPNPVSFASETGLSATEGNPVNRPDVAPKSSEGTCYAEVSRVV